MTRAIVVALGFALSLGTVLAQPTPKQPTPKQPAPKQPPEGTGDGSGSGTGSGSSGNVTQNANDDNLQKGNDEERPWAKGVSKERQDTALRLFSEANRALNNGLFQAALQKYQEALKSWEHPAIYYNMALAQMNLDQPIEVEKSLTKAIAYGPKPLEKDKFEHAQQYLVINAKQLAWVDVSCKKVGANVFIDDEKVFTVTPGKENRVVRRVKVGKHTIVAERTGYNAQVDAPYIESGQKFAIELQLYTSDELTRYRRRWPNKTWLPYAVIGTGVALGGFGVLMSSSAQSSYDKFDTAIANCNNNSGGMGCIVTSDITGLRDSGDNKKLLSYLGYGLAGATVVAGGVMVYLNRRTSYEITADEYRKELAAKKRAKAAHVVPMVSPDVAGAMVLGRF